VIKKKRKEKDVKNAEKVFPFASLRKGAKKGTTKLMSLLHKLRQLNQYVRAT
jgi:hypothetical protein